ncbi:MAG: hypothetical protein Q7T61_11580 [Caulobacter sp.]|nr:hypothetical protein [Caulobacter sp.]
MAILLPRRRLGAAILALSLACGPGLGQAAATKPTDEVTDAPLSVLQKPENLDRIGRDITFVFADAPGPIPQEGRLRSRKQVRNSKNAQADCEAALVLSLEGFAASARKHGATRVINMRSFWGGYPTSSAQTYKCARSKKMTSISLVGTLEGVK